MASTFIFADFTLIFVVLLFGVFAWLFSFSLRIFNGSILLAEMIGALIFTFFGKYIGNYWGNWSQIIALLLAGMIGAFIVFLFSFLLIKKKVSPYLVLWISFSLWFSQFLIKIVTYKYGYEWYIDELNSSYRLLTLGDNNFFNVYLLIAIIFVITVILIKMSKSKTYWIQQRNNKKILYSASMASGFLAALAGAIFTFTRFNYDQTYYQANFIFSINKIIVLFAIIILIKWRLFFIILTLLVVTFLLLYMQQFDEVAPILFSGFLVFVIFIFWRKN